MLISLLRIDRSSKRIEKNDGIISMLLISVLRVLINIVMNNRRRKNNLMKKIGVDSKRPVLLYIATDIVLEADT